MDLSFLDGIETDELDGKDEVIKSIRFSSDEFYLLKYCKYLDKRFATYVKELIVQDIKNRNNELNREMDIEKLKEELKEELRTEIKEELLEEIREELSKYKIEELQDTMSDDKKDLLEFMNNR